MKEASHCNRQSIKAERVKDVNPLSRMRQKVIGLSSSVRTACAQDHEFVHTTTINVCDESRALKSLLAKSAPQIVGLRDSKVQDCDRQSAAFDSQFEVRHPMKRLFWIAIVLAAVLGTSFVAMWRAPEEPSPLPERKISAVVAPKNSSKPGPAVFSRAQTPPRAARLDPADLTARKHDRLIRGFNEKILRFVELEEKLMLTDNEHDRLLDDVMDFQSAEAMIDASFINVTFFDGAKLVLEIPPHPEQSATVRMAFAQQIRQDFPTDVADQIVGALDSDSGFDVLFSGFGKFSQTHMIGKPRDDGRMEGVHVAAAVPPGEGPVDAATARIASLLSSDGVIAGREMLDLAYQALMPTIDRYFPKNPAEPLPERVP